MTTSSDRPDTAAGQRPSVATACGKVILLGEHSVVYGEPAIAVPLSGMRLSVVLASPSISWVPPGAKDSGPIQAPIAPGAPQDDVSTLAMPAWGSPEFQQFSEDERAASLPAAPTLEGSEHPPLTIDVESGAPAGARGDVSRALGTAAHELGVPVPLPVRVAVRSGGLRSGMGTSAALGTAVTRALLQWYGGEPVPDRVLPAVAAVEQLFHSNPSGIDHTVSVHEAPVWFEKEKPPLPLSGLPELQLVLLPRTSGKGTSELVEGVRAAILGDPHLIRVIAEMGRWSRDGLAAWRAGDLAGLGEAMTQQQRSLDRIGVVNDDDRAGVALAIEAGALGAKITGAGWGGTLLALVDDDSTDSVARAWGDGAVLVRVG